MKKTINMVEGCTLTNNEIEDIYFLVTRYYLAVAAREYVHTRFKGCRALSKKECYKMAEKVYGLLISGDYTDIEYAMEEAYLDAPDTYQEDDEINYPVYYTKELIRPKRKEMENVTISLLSSKMAPMVKRLLGNRNPMNVYSISKDAVKLLLSGEFTDLEDAVLEADFLKQGGFDYKKHPLLKEFDDILCIADDRYIDRIGRQQQDVWDDYGRLVISKPEETKRIPHLMEI